MEAPVLSLLLLALLCALPVREWLGSGVRAVTTRVVQLVPGAAYFMGPTVEPPHIVLGRLEREVKTITAMVASLQTQLTELGQEGGAVGAGSSHVPSRPAAGHSKGNVRSSSARAVDKPQRTRERTTAAGSTAAGPMRDNVAGGAPPGGEQ